MVLPSSSIIRLQHIQNSLAHVVCNSSRFQAHTTSLLNNLHWLPVTQLIKYKIALLTFKTLRFVKPSYLSELLLHYQPLRKLRSSDANLLDVPKILTSIGRHSFSFAASTVWNTLSADLRSYSPVSIFCGKLETNPFLP